MKSSLIVFGLISLAFAGNTAQASGYMNCTLYKDGWEGMPSDFSQFPGITPPTAVANDQTPMVLRAGPGPAMIALDGMSQERTGPDGMVSYAFDVEMYPVNGDITDADVDIIIYDRVNQNTGQEKISGVNLNSPRLHFEMVAYTGSNASRGLYLTCSLE